METTSHLLPSSTTFNTFDTMDSPEPQNYLKFEDLHSSASPAASFDNDSVAESSSPPPVIVTSKPAKKRKSWGQELPEPTTTLPPRKRAKTDDEKEQRRIERIKRNRAAAHNSRERKRQETEVLAVALAKVQAELDAYRKLHGPLPASIKLPEVQLSIDSGDTPVPSFVDSRGSIDAFPSPATTTDDLFENSVIIKQEPTETLFPATLPPAFENLDNKPATTLSLLDPTQHSAAMLCDLQCRSTSSSSNNNQTMASYPSTSANYWWTTLFLYLINLQLQTTYKAFLMTIWSLSPSRTARLMQASTHRLTSASTTSSTTPPRQLSRSTLAQAQLNAATASVFARRCALALQRRSVVQVQRARFQAAAARQHRQQSDTKAFQENGRTGKGGGDGVGR